MGLLSTFASLGGSSVGTGVVDLQLNTAQFDRGLATSEGKLRGTTQLMGGQVSRLSQLTTAGVAGVAAGVALGAVAVVNAASDEEEALNKVMVVFEDSASTVTDFAETSATAFGISKAAALQAAGGFGSMLQTAGLAVDESAEMSVALVKLSADLASFNNVDPTEALEKLRAGLAGEAEPLRVMGVFLSEARVQAEAFSSGIAKQGEELTEAQKVQARYNIILEDTTKAQGDFQRTSDSAANQQRILSAKVADTAAEIGKSLLPVFSALLDVASIVIDALKPLLDILTDIIGAITELGQHQIVKDIIGVFYDTGGAAAYTTDQLNDTKEKMRETIGEFEDGEISFKDAKEEIIRLGEALGYDQKSIEDWVQNLERARFMIDRFSLGNTEAREGLGETGEAASRAGRRIRAFASMTTAETEEWRDEVRSDLRQVSLTLDGLSGDWRKTARETIQAARRMARGAAQIAEDLDKLADIRAPAEFKRWLVDQGPGWVSGYVRATKSGKDAIEGYWRDASKSVRDQKDALDEVISKADRLKARVNNLPDQKTINIRLNVTGVSDTATGQQIADALAREAVRAGG